MKQQGFNSSSEADKVSFYFLVILFQIQVIIHMLFCFVSLLPTLKYSLSVGNPVCVLLLLNQIRYNILLSLANHQKCLSYCMRLSLYTKSFKQIQRASTVRPPRRRTSLLLFIRGRFLLQVIIIIIIVAILYSNDNHWVYSLRRTGSQVVQSPAVARSFKLCLRW